MAYSGHFFNVQKAFEQPRGMSCLVPGMLKKGPVLPENARPAVQAEILAVQFGSNCCTVLCPKRYVSGSTGRNGTDLITMIECTIGLKGVS